MFKGSLVALITPMRQDGSVDEKAYAAFVDWQIQEGTHGVVPVGTTGESPTLSHARAQARGGDRHRGGEGPRAGDRRRRLNSTEEAIDADPPRQGGRRRRRAGRDAVLQQADAGGHVSCTSRRSPTRWTCRSSSTTFPPRSVVDMSVETMARLAKHKNIIGVKDATANLARPLHTRRACGADFCQLSGEDHTALAFNAAGGVGCISVTANVAPRLCSDMQTAWMEGRFARGDGDPEPPAAAARRAVQPRPARRR